jgi:hypothetical protein
MEGTRTPQREQTNKTEICHNEPHLVLFDKYFYYGINSRMLCAVNQLVYHRITTH